MIVNWKKALELAANPGPRLVGGVQIVLVLALAYNLAQVSWRFLPQVKELPLSVPAFSQSGPQAAVSSGPQIPQLHLFGEAAVEPVSAVPENLPETNLKLTLRGVIASPDPKSARAIVADPAGKDDFYKIGDTLPGNATLKEIHGDRIVIQRGGRYETLKLPKESLNTGGVVQASTAAAIGQPRTPSSLREFRNALLNNPNEVADLVRIMPKNEGGRFVGYQLQPGRDPQFLARYGLMSMIFVSDLLDSPAKGMQVMRDLSKADTLDIEVERNGIRQRFTLPIN